MGHQQCSPMPHWFARFRGTTVPTLTNPLTNKAAPCTSGCIPAGAVQADGMLRQAPRSLFPSLFSRLFIIPLYSVFLFLITLFSSVGLLLPNHSVQDILFWGEERFDGVGYVVLLVLIGYCVYSQCDDWGHCIRHSINARWYWTGKELTDPLRPLNMEYQRFRLLQKN